MMTAPTPDSIRQLYDNFTEVFVKVWGENIHLGYWEDPRASVSTAEATERLTSELIAHMNVTRGQRVLDVGCGIGKPALRLANELGVEVVGVSTSQRHVDHANASARRQGMADRVSFQCADANHLPFDNASFDAIWALESMHHMQDRAHVLRELARVLRQEGTLALADFMLGGPVEGEEKALIDDFRVGSGALTLTLISEYKAEVTSAGFEVLETVDISEQVRPSMLRWADTFRAVRDEFVEYIGAQELDRMININERISVLPEMGYLLLTARRH